VLSVHVKEPLAGGNRQEQAAQAKFKIIHTYHEPNILFKAFPNLLGALAGATEFVHCAEIFLCDRERNRSAYGQCSCAMMMVL